MDSVLLKERKDKIEDIIKGFLPQADEYNGELCEAVSYSVNVGGKRLRPMLMQEMYRSFSSEDEPEELHVLMAAIEFIHTYSLVHDDLPAMDNDELRRGKATTHKKYGEAFGILAGDALLNYAYEIIFSSLQKNMNPSSARAAMILSKKAGLYGMVGGQYIDVYAEKHEGFSVDKNTIHYIYKNKTAALLEASMMIGAVIGGADDAQLEIVEEMAADIGFAFQIQDDILDVTGDQNLLGKPVGSDERNDKQTYVALYGLDKATEAVKEYTDKAMKLFEQLDIDNSFLKDLIISLIGREQ